MKKEQFEEIEKTIRSIAQSDQPEETQGQQKTLIYKNSQQKMPEQFKKLPKEQQMQIMQQQFQNQAKMQRLQIQSLPIEGDPADPEEALKAMEKRAENEQAEIKKRKREADMKVVKQQANLIEEIKKVKTKSKTFPFQLMKQEREADQINIADFFYMDKYLLRLWAFVISRLAFMTIPHSIHARAFYSPKMYKTKDRVLYTMKNLHKPQEHHDQVKKEEAGLWEDDTWGSWEVTQSIFSKHIKSSAYDDN